MEAGSEFTFTKVLEAFEKLSIPRGPTHETEYRWLHDQTCRIASDSHPEVLILECGTLHGASAIAIGMALKRAKQIYASKGIVSNSQLISVDNYSDFDKSSRNGSSPNTIKERMLKCNLEDTVQVIKSDELEYIPILKDRSVNMAWLDSTHQQAPVSKQLEVVFPKMAHNSLLCGHEYNGLLTIGVLYAVEDFRCKYKEHLCGFGVHDRIWWTMVRNL